METIAIDLSLGSPTHLRSLSYLGRGNCSIDATWHAC